MKRFIVVYLSEGGMHCRYRCSAKSKHEARQICRKCMGISDRLIVDVYEED